MNRRPTGQSQCLPLRIGQCAAPPTCNIRTRLPSNSSAATPCCNLTTSLLAKCGTRFTSVVCETRGAHSRNVVQSRHTCKVDCVSSQVDNSHVRAYAWQNGRMFNRESSAYCGAASSFEYALVTRFRFVSTTPLGCEIVPDVYSSCAGASGLMYSFARLVETDRLHTHLRDGSSPVSVDSGPVV